jgi:hypothetical protein
MYEWHAGNPAGALRWAEAGIWWRSWQPAYAGPGAGGAQPAGRLLRKLAGKDDLRDAGEDT